MVSLGLWLTALLFSPAHGFLSYFTSEVVDLTPLGANKFATKIESYDIVLVKFYAPWCGHCKSLAPEYEKAAKELKGATEKMALAEVNCDSGPGREICAAQDVSSFPTIKLFKNGRHAKNYRGERTAKAIKNFMEHEKVMLSPAKRLKNFEQLTQSRADRMNEKRIHVVALFRAGQKGKDKLIKEFHTTAERERWGIEFMHATLRAGVEKDEKLLSELNELGEWPVEEAPVPEEISKWTGSKMSDKWEAGEGSRRRISLDDLPVVMIFRPALYHHAVHDPHMIYNFTQPASKSGGLRKWIKKNFVSLVGHREYVNEEFFQKPLFVAYYKVDFEGLSEVTQKWRGMMSGVARKWYPRYQFAVADWNKYRHELREVQLIPPEENVTDLMPIMIGWERNGMRHLMHAAFTPEAIDKFVSQVRDQKIRPYLKSSDEPADNDERAVPEVTGLSFWHRVEEHKRDVFLMLYDPKCPYCKKVLPHWERLGHLMRETGNNHISILQMNVLANELPHPYEAVLYPTIYWVPARDRRNPRKYDGGRDLDSFVAFISQYASAPLKGFDKEGLEPSEYKLDYKPKYEL